MSFRERYRTAIEILTVWTGTGQEQMAYLVYAATIEGLRRDVKARTL